MSIHKLYEQDILDHYQHPRNFGLLLAYDFISPVFNPSCGDSVAMCGVIQNGVIEKLTFEGKGCVLSLAMASKLTEFAQEKTLGEILALNEGLVEQLLKMQLGLKRMQCGLLPLQALQQGIKLYQQKAF